MTNHDLIAEIVSFRALPTTTDAAMTSAADALGPFLDGRAGFVSRTLSRDPDGTWTDYLLWSDLALARAAAEDIMSRPEAAALMALVDPDSVRMTHAPVLISKAA